MRAPVLVGCCGFPVARVRYGAEFPVVEVQQTFYQPPRVATAVRWRQEAPPGFRFAMKAWQLVTHPATSPTYRRLREPLAGPPDAYGFFRATPEVDRAWSRTVEVARALGAEVVLLQCPASFRPEPENVERLRRFAARAGRDGLRLAWEPRGGWPPALVAGLCRELGLLHAGDPLAGALSPGEVAYFRLHGRGGYRYRHTDADLDELLARCRDAISSGAREAWVLFNNLSMLEDARRFLALVRTGR